MNYQYSHYQALKFHKTQSQLDLYKPLSDEEKRLEHALLNAPPDMDHPAVQYGAALAGIGQNVICAISAASDLNCTARPALARFLRSIALELEAGGIA
jgi:hypothetical protein